MWFYKRLWWRFQLRFRSKKIPNVKKVKIATESRELAFIIISRKNISSQLTSKQKYQIVNAWMFDRTFRSALSANFKRSKTDLKDIAHNLMATTFLFSKEEYRQVFSDIDLIKVYSKYAYKNVFRDTYWDVIEKKVKEELDDSEKTDEPKWATLKKRAFKYPEIAKKALMSERLNPHLKSADFIKMLAKHASSSNPSNPSESSELPELSERRKGFYDFITRNFEIIRNRFFSPGHGTGSQENKATVGALKAVPTQQSVFLPEASTSSTTTSSLTSTSVPDELASGRPRTSGKSTSLMDPFNFLVEKEYDRYNYGNKGLSFFENGFLLTQLEPANFQALIDRHRKNGSAVKTIANALTSSDLIFKEKAVVRLISNYTLFSVAYSGENVTQRINCLIKYVETVKAFSEKLSPEQVNKDNTYAKFSYNILPAAKALIQNKTARLLIGEKNLAEIIEKHKGDPGFMQILKNEKLVTQQDGQQLATTSNSESKGKEKATIIPKIAEEKMLKEASQFNERAQERFVNTLKKYITAGNAKAIVKHLESCDFYEEKEKLKILLDHLHLPTIRVKNFEEQRVEKNVENKLATVLKPWIKKAKENIDFAYLLFGSQFAKAALYNNPKDLVDILIAHINDDYFYHLLKTKKLIKKENLVDILSPNRENHDLETAIKALKNKRLSGLFTKNELEKIETIKIKGAVQESVGTFKKVDEKQKAEEKAKEYETKRSEIRQIADNLKMVQVALGSETAAENCFKEASNISKLSSLQIAQILVAHAGFFHQRLKLKEKVNPEDRPFKVADLIMNGNAEIAMLLATAQPSYLDFLTLPQLIQLEEKHCKALNNENFQQYYEQLGLSQQEQPSSKTIEHAYNKLPEQIKDKFDGNSRKLFMVKSKLLPLIKLRESIQAIYLQQFVKLEYQVRHRTSVTAREPRENIGILAKSSVEMAMKIFDNEEMCRLLTKEQLNEISEHFKFEASDKELLRISENSSFAFIKAKATAFEKGKGKENKGEDTIAVCAARVKKIVELKERVLEIKRARASASETLNIPSDYRSDSVSTKQAPQDHKNQTGRILSFLWQRKGRKTTNKKQTPSWEKTVIAGYSNKSPTTPQM